MPEIELDHIPPQQPAGCPECARLRDELRRLRGELITLRREWQAGLYGSAGERIQRLGEEAQR